MIREPHTSFLASSWAPLPDPLPDIKLGPGPEYPDYSYLDYRRWCIWLLKTDWHNRGALYHEMGHAFDRLYLTPELRREAARRFIGHKGLRWFWGSWNPLRHLKQPNEENFADAYAEACLHHRPRFEHWLRTIKRAA